MWAGEQEDKIFVPGVEGNIPEALANALRGHFGEAVSIGCQWVRKRFVFLRVWADSAPDAKRLIVATYHSVKLSNGYEVAFSFRTEDRATPESACCPPAFYESIAASNPAWRQSCVQYASALATLGRLKPGTLIHVRKPLGDDIAKVFLLTYEGKGQYRSIPVLGANPRMLKLSKEDLAAHWPQVYKPESIAEAKDTIRARNAVLHGEYLICAVANRAGCHDLIGRMPAGGFSPAAPWERPRPARGAVLFL